MDFPFSDKLNFNSVEHQPGFNARAAFTVNSQSVFKEDADIVNYIRLNERDFKEWHSSDTAKLFAPPIFCNERKASGY